MSEGYGYTGKQFLTWQDITAMVSKLLGQVNPNDFDCILGQYSNPLIRIHYP